MAAAAAMVVIRRRGTVWVHVCCCGSTQANNPKVLSFKLQTDKANAH